MHLEVRSAEKLSHRERQVVALKEAGKNVATSTKSIGISPATVNTLYNRARNKGYQVVIIIPGEEWGISSHDTNDEE
jgi:transposase